MQNVYIVEQGLPLVLCASFLCKPKLTLLFPSKTAFSPFCEQKTIATDIYRIKNTMAAQLFVLLKEKLYSGLCMVVVEMGKTTLYCGKLVIENVTI